MHFESAMHLELITLAEALQSQFSFSTCESLINCYPVVLCECKPSFKCAQSIGDLCDLPKLVNCCTMHNVNGAIRSDHVNTVDVCPLVCESDIQCPDQCHVYWLTFPAEFDMHECVRSGGRATALTPDVPTTSNDFITINSTVINMICPDDKGRSAPRFIPRLIWFLFLAPAPSSLFACALAGGCWMRTKTGWNCYRLRPLSSPSSLSLRWMWPLEFRICGPY